MSTLSAIGETVPKERMRTSSDIVAPAAYVVHVIPFPVVKVIFSIVVVILLLDIIVGLGSLRAYIGPFARFFLWRG